MSMENLGRACEANDLLSVQELIKLPSIQLNIHHMVKVVFPDYDVRRKGQQSTVLNIACHFSSYEIVNILLQFSKTDIVDYYRNLPIHYASGSRVDALKKVQALLEQNQQDVHTKGYVGTPLHCATMAGITDVVDYLFQNGANLESEKRLLHRVTSTGNAEMMQLLMTNGADPMKVDDFEQTVLHCASRFNKQSIIDLILETCQEAINKPDSKGNTPLHLATDFGKIETVGRLTATGKCDLGLRNKQGETVFEIAKVRNKHDIAAHLSQLETPGNSISPNEDEQFGNIPETCVVTKKKHPEFPSQTVTSNCVKNKNDVGQIQPRAPVRKSKRKDKNGFTNSRSLSDVTPPKTYVFFRPSEQSMVTGQQPQASVSRKPIDVRENDKTVPPTQDNDKSVLSESGETEEIDDEVFYGDRDYLRQSRKSLVERVESLERRLARSDENRNKVVDEKLKSMYDRIRMIEKDLGRLRDNTLSKEKKRETQLALQEEVGSLKDTVLMLQKRLDEGDKCFSPGKFQNTVLMKVAKLIGSEQFQLHPFLGVTYEEYQQFQQKHPHQPVNVSFEMLRTWRDNNLCADDAEKLQNLMEAFKEVDRDMDQTLKDILNC